MKRQDLEVLIIKSINESDGGEFSVDPHNLATLVPIEHYNALLSALHSLAKNNRIEVVFSARHPYETVIRIVNVR